jgi:hypothetical protein
MEITWITVAQECANCMASVTGLVVGDHCWNCGWAFDNEWDVQEMQAETKQINECTAAQRQIAELRFQISGLEAALRYIAKVTCVYDRDDARDVYRVVKAALKEPT